MRISEHPEDLDDLANALARIRPEGSMVLTIHTPRFSYWCAQVHDLHLLLQRLVWPPVAIQINRSREESLVWKG